MIYATNFFPSFVDASSDWHYSYDAFEQEVSKTASIAKSPHFAIKITERASKTVSWDKVPSFYAIIWTGCAENLEHLHDRRYMILRAYNAKSSSHDGISKNLMGANLQRVRFVSEKEWDDYAQASTCLPKPRFITPFSKL